MTDPWRDCERLYEKHFLERMRERHLPRDQVEEALQYGDRMPEGEGIFKVKWNRWTLVVAIGICIVDLQTAYRD